MQDNSNYHQVFIAYKGTETSPKIIKKELKRLCPHNYTVKMNYLNKSVIFAKIVNENEYYSEPYWNSYHELLTVSGYKEKDLEDIAPKLSEYIYCYCDNNNCC